jgi:O-antigen ligase
MARTAEHRPHSTPPEQRWKASLLGIAFTLAIALVIARATMNQNLRDREMVVPGSIDTPRAAGPATTLAMDLLMWTPAILVLIRRARDPDFRLRSSVSHGLFAALAMLAASSSVWASDKFAAAVTSSHLIAAAALMWAMTQLVRSWVQLRLVAGACFGMLLIYIAQGIMYRTVDLPDNVKYWQQYGPDELRRLNYEPGSFAAQQFERKLLSGELYGFFNSPNTFAAVIVMLGIVLAGAAIQRIHDRDEPGWAGAIIVGVLLSLYILYFTYSKTSMLTPLLAIAILVAAPRLRAQWRTKFYLAGVAIFIIGVLAVVGHGLYHGSLVQESLTYRWRYWVGAMRVFAAHPLLGVGWANFGAYYLGARLPIASEEIKDPHNLIIRPLVELGIFGGILMLTWLARIWWELTSAGNSLITPADEESNANARRAGRTIFGICGLAMLLNILASVDFTLQAPGAGWYIMLELFKRLLYFVLLLLGVSAISLKSSTQADLDDREAPWLLWGIIAAIAVFLVHNLIDFSLFEPGPMLMFAMLLGAVIGARTQPRTGAGAPRAMARLAAAGSLAALIAAGIGVAAPIAVAESTAHAGDEQIRNAQLPSGAAKLRDAFESL